MSEVELRSVGHRYLVHDINDAEVIIQQRYLVQETLDISDVSKLRLLRYLNDLYQLDYVFTPSNLKFWNFSPLYIEDPENPKRTVVRLTALNGNGKYTGYRDFVYNRINLTDYCRLVEKQFITDRYQDQEDLDTIYNLLGQEIGSTDVDITVSTDGDVTIYRIEAVDPNSLLWYGVGEVRVSDIPDISTVIPINSFTMSD